MRLQHSFSEQHPPPTHSWVPLREASPSITPQRAQRWTRVLVVVLLSTVCIESTRAQQEMRPLRVLVYDSLSSNPLPGITVVVSPSTTILRNFPSVADTPVEAVTDSQGLFEMRVPVPPQGYRFRLKWDGFLTTEMDPLEVIKGLREGILKVPFAPSGQITGRVVDQDTGEGVKGIEVAALSFRSLRLGVSSEYGNLNGVKTDSDGRFLLPDMVSGQYTLIMRPRLWELDSSDQSTDEFTQESIAAPGDGDEDYELTFWPGGRIELAQPFSLTTGSAFDVGSIRIRRAPYFRAHVDFADCRPGAPGANTTLEATLFTRLDGRLPQKRLLGKVMCGDAFTVRSLSPGAFRLEVLRPGLGGNRWVSDFVIVDSNVELKMTPQMSADLTGRVVLVKESQPTLAELLESRGKQPLTIRVEPLDTTLDPGSRSAFVDGEGVSHFRGIPFGQMRPTFGGAMDAALGDYMLTDVRYAGRVLSDPYFFWDGGGDLEFVFDDHAGGATGTVTNGQNPVERATVWAVPWPLFQGPWLPYMTSWHIGRTTSNSAGQFQIKGLADGEYRLLAFEIGSGGQESAARIDVIAQGDLIRTRAQSAQRLTVRRGEISTVTLRVIDLTR